MAGGNTRQGWAVVFVVLVIVLAVWDVWMIYGWGGPKEDRYPLGLVMAIVIDAVIVLFAYTTYYAFKPRKKITTTYYPGQEAAKP